MTLTDYIETEAELEEQLSEPTDGVTAVMGRLEGDLMFLGAGGKMGPTLARMAKRGSEAAGKDRRIIAVSRFTNRAAAEALERHGVETVACDLLEEAALERLPCTPNVVFMTGMKFGSAEEPSTTWAMNAYLPGVAARHFAESRIAAFSTGNVYPLTPVSKGGSVETDDLYPVGEYGMSCLGRERVFTYASRKRNTPTSIIRLNYACECRYGVLTDIAHKVWNGDPVDVTMGYANVIWQSDANAMALQTLDHTAVPPFVINTTGKEILSVRSLAERFGEALGKPAVITGEEAPDALLSNPDRAYAELGPPKVSLDTMIRWIAHWVKLGGETLGKPTHFEVRSGQF